MKNGLIGRVAPVSRAASTRFRNWGHSSNEAILHSGAGVAVWARAPHRHPLRHHCCPRRDRPVAWPAENTRLGGTPVGYLGGGLRIKVAQPVQVIPKPG